MRFDGIEPSTKSGFYNYDYDFGVSVLGAGNNIVDAG